VPRTRFLVSEAMPIPGIFGLPHHWSTGKPAAKSVAREAASAEPVHTTA